MQVRVVTRQLPTAILPTVHKAFYFCPSMLSAQGVKDIEEHIASEIEKDIKKFTDQFVEFRRATFKIARPEDVPTVYIG